MVFTVSMTLRDDLDLNLLRTLDVLLATRSVTETSRRIGRSQPAVSHALSRLRDALDDPLLVRQGNTLVPTPRAEAIGPALHALLLDLGRTLERATTFDPARSQRTFRLACPNMLAPVVPELLAALRDAPGCRLELVAVRGVEGAAVADVSLDLLPEDAPGIVARRLGELRQGVLLRAGHPLAGRERLSLEDWLSVPHVFVRTGTADRSLVDLALAARGRERTVGLVATDVLLAAHVVARSDQLFTGPRAVLGLLAGRLDVVVVDPPMELDFPRATAAALWQERLASDPGHRWFRQRVVETMVGVLR